MHFGTPITGRGRSWGYRWYTIRKSDGGFLYRLSFVICNHCAISNRSAQSWQWVTLWPVTHVTYHSADCDPHDLSPMTQSGTMPWVNHDYLRIMMSFRLAYWLLFSAMMYNLEFWIWLFQWILYNSLSLSLHSIWQFLQAEHGEQLIFLADRTNGRAIATLLRLSSVVCLWRYVLWLNGAS